MGNRVKKWVTVHGFRVQRFGVQKFEPLIRELRIEKA